ncbi:nitroreductase/quinone reductase family protein [Nocardia sp. CDC160]|uniref:nitroreductase/quinone reductase family protein n=1 Tax=Nocardia sp. CDC160 TaxID=3112166 RepID=UPI002DBE8225|nr:nitroreductase/quinone reductase family protein [Nocardia sp. CDC160]MEC3920251.1 nitroreductase/quinone reductase family protein [Nocardia sp. CDC160]
MTRSTSSRAEELALKVMLPVLIGLYRLSGGRLAGSMNGTSIMLLTTTGRRSGQRRTVPVSYLASNSTYIVAATNGGRDTQPGWYHNVRTQPQVTIQVKDRTMTAVAEIVDPQTRDELWARLVTSAPQIYQGLQARTTRTFPIVIFRPTP